MRELERYVLRKFRNYMMAYYLYNHWYIHFVQIFFYIFMN